MEIKFKTAIRFLKEHKSWKLSLINIGGRLEGMER